MMLEAANAVGAAALPSAAPAAISAGTLGGMVLSLLVVLGIILVSAWLLRRLPGLGQQGGGLLKVRATLAVGLKERVVLVEAAGETLLLGVSAGGVQCLHRFDAPLPTQAPTGQESGFAALLAQRLGKRGERSP